MKSGILNGVILRRLARNARDDDSNPVLANISQFHHLHDTGVLDQDPEQVTHCMVIECTLHGHCLYEIVSIKRLTIPSDDC